MAAAAAAAEESGGGEEGGEQQRSKFGVGGGEGGDGGAAWRAAVAADFLRVVAGEERAEREVSMCGLRSVVERRWLRRGQWGEGGCGVGARGG